MNANVMMNERGWGKVFRAPSVDVDHRAARLSQVEFVLTRLSAVCRPLVVQAIYETRDEFGLSAIDGPDNGAAIARSNHVPAHVHVRPTIEQLPPTFTGVDMSPRGLCDWLRATVPAHTDSYTGDWASLETLATEARAFVKGSTLRFDKFPRTISAHGCGAEPWFAGPVGKEYFERLAPMQVEFWNEPTTLRVQISRYWNFLEPHGRPRETSLESVFFDLQAAGFVDQTRH